MVATTDSGWDFHYYTTPGVQSAYHRFEQRPEKEVLCGERQKIEEGRLQQPSLIRRCTPGCFDSGTRTLRTLAWATTPTELHNDTSTIVHPPARDFKGKFGKALFPKEDFLWK